LGLMPNPCPHIRGGVQVNHFPPACVKEKQRWTF
jgi:hypothetical protein